MRVLLGTMAALALISSASAADLPAKVAIPAPVPVPVLNWTGFYIGVNGGYSWGKSSRDIVFTSLATGVPIAAGTTDSTNLNGGLFGGQIGYNWQAGNWVFGLETDAQWTGQKGSATALCSAVIAGCLPGLTFIPAGALGTAAAVDQRLEWFGTARGRLGILVVPSVLLYATGGAAYGSVKTDVALAGFTAAGLPVAVVGSDTTTRFGWTVGAGIEAMFGSNWSGKIEYLYTDLGTVNGSTVLATGAATGIAANVSSRITDNVIRGGISYHFNAGGPVVARY